MSSIYQVQDLSGYVPYTGATQTLDLLTTAQSISAASGLFRNALTGANAKRIDLISGAPMGYTMELTANGGYILDLMANDYVFNFQDTSFYIDYSSNLYTVGKITSAGLISPLLYPASDSTTAVKITKADGTTGVVVVDTTNSKVGFGGNPDTFPAKIQIFGNSIDGMVTCVASNSAGFCPSFYFKRSKGTQALRTAVVDGNTIFAIFSQGHDGSDFVVGAQEKSFVDGTVSTGVVPMGFQWSTMPPAGGSVTERMRLSSSGNLSVTGTLTVGASGLVITPSWDGLGGAWINMPTTGNSGLGSGGAGQNTWLGYAASNNNWFIGSLIGDIAYRNNGYRLLFGVGDGTGTFAMSINTNNYVDMGANTSMSYPRLRLAGYSDTVAMQEWGDGSGTVYTRILRTSGNIMRMTQANYGGNYFEFAGNYAFTGIGSFNNGNNSIVSCRVETGQFSMGGSATFGVDAPGVTNGRFILDTSGHAGVGVTSPTAILHLKAGTATAGTAPLKIPSGTLLGTKEAGAIENDGTHIYWSKDATNRYQLDQQNAGAPGGVSGDAQINNGTGGFSGITGVSSTGGVPYYVSVCNGIVVSVCFMDAMTAGYLYSNGSGTYSWQTPCTGYTSYSTSSALTSVSESTSSAVTSVSYNTSSAVTSIDFGMQSYNTSSFVTDVSSGTSSFISSLSPSSSSFVTSLS